MQIWGKIKEAWPLVTKKRFLRMKKDKDALLEQHHVMSDHVLEYDLMVKDAVKRVEQALSYLKKAEF